MTIFYPVRGAEGGLRLWLDRLKPVSNCLRDHQNARGVGTQNKGVLVHAR